MSDVIQPTGLDQVRVDRRLLSTLVMPSRLARKVRTLTDGRRVEPCLQTAQDLAASMQSFGADPCPEVPGPTLPGLPPMVAVVLKPAVPIRGEPVLRRSCAGTWPE